MKYLSISLLCIFFLTGFLSSKNFKHPFYPGSCFVHKNKTYKVLMVKNYWAWVGSSKDKLPNMANPVEIGKGEKTWINLYRLNSVIHMDPITCKKY